MRSRCRIPFAFSAAYLLMTWLDWALAAALSCQLWHVGSSSPAEVGPWAPRTGAGVLATEPPGKSPTLQNSKWNKGKEEITQYQKKEVELEAYNI